MGIILLVYAMHIPFPQFKLPEELKIYIDNPEVVRRDQINLSSLGFIQQLVLDYDICATTHRLLEVLPSTIQ